MCKILQTLSRSTNAFTTLCIILITVHFFFINTQAQTEDYDDYIFGSEDEDDEDLAYNGTIFFYLFFFLLYLK